MDNLLISITPVPKQSLVGDDYSYWELGVTRAFGKVALDIRYHDTSRWLRIISSPETADASVVLSAKILF
jgi:hypothetical protein